MKNTTLLGIALTLASLLVVGCGGGGSSHGSSSTTGTSGGLGGSGLDPTTGGGGSTTDDSNVIGFSDPSGYNGSTTSLKGFTSLKGIYNASLHYLMVTGYVVNGSNSRTITVVLSGDAAPGAPLDLAGRSTPGVIYTQGITGNKGWTSASGTVTIASIASGKIVVQLKDVRVSHADDNSESTGEVTLDGTLAVDDVSVE